MSLACFLLVWNSSAFGFRNMIAAREALRTEFSKFIALRGFLVKSGIIEQAKLINGNIKEFQNFSSRVTLKQLWNIDRVEKVIEVDFTNDELLGSLAKKHLKKDDRIYRYTYKAFKIDEQDDPDLQNQYDSYG